MANKTLTKGERTRQELIDAACTLFVKQGYHGTSMRSIAESVGVVVGAVYKHFSSKEELFRTVVHQRHPFNLMLPALDESTGDTVEELLREAMVRMVAMLENDLESLNMMFIEMIEFEGRHLGELVESFAPRVAAFAQRVEAAGGELRPAPPFAFFRSLLGTVMMYFLTNRMVAKAPIPLEMFGSLDDLLNNYLHGVLADDTD